jgi:DNA (cytosine-5)-methyltransferase 1
MIKAASLFSGIGGFEKGFQQASVMSETVFTSEIDKYARQIYKKNFGVEPHGDITQISATEIPDHDILCGGFPCQAFSVAGKRRGFEDTRGTLFFEIMRIAEAKRPKLLFLENVKGLLSHDKGGTFQIILRSMDELGYDAEWQVFNSKDHGVPQNRERVFIIGHLRGSGTRPIFPITEHDRSTDDLQRLNANTLTARYEGAQAVGTYIIENQFDAQSGSNIRRLTPTECERLQGFPDGWTEGVSDTQRYKCLGNAVTVNVVEFIARHIINCFKN